MKSIPINERNVAAKKTNRSFLYSKPPYDKNWWTLEITFVNNSALLLIVNFSEFLTIDCLIVIVVYLLFCSVTA